MLESAGEPTGRGNEVISQGRLFPRHWSWLFSRFFGWAPRTSIVTLDGGSRFSPCCGYSPKFKKREAFSPFFGTQFAPHCSPTPLRAKLDPTGGSVQQRHAVAFAKQVERHCQNIKGRPALPAARPFFHSRSAFYNLGYCLLSLPQ